MCSDVVARSCRYVSSSFVIRKQSIDKSNGIDVET
jgi:hypothetical protein